MSKKRKMSYNEDRYNHTTPQDERYEYEEDLRLEGEEDDECWTPSDTTQIYKEGIEYLAKETGSNLNDVFYLVPSVTGTNAYHDAWVDTPVSFTSQEHLGYCPPNDFIVRRKVYKADNDGLIFERLKNKLLDYINSCHNPKLAGKFWEPIFSPQIERRKPLYGAAMNFIQEREQLANKAGRFYDGISLTGTNSNFGLDSNSEHTGVYKWIPQESWFDDRIKVARPEDLLVILPPAERDMFMLLLGRVMVGRKNSITTEGTLLDHTFRSMGLLVGKSAGLGKSTVFEHIFAALDTCGYVVSVFEDVGARFGWGEIISADLAYNDDLTPDDQKKLLKSALTKSIISNGRLRTERKGVDAISTYSRCVLMCNSNDYNNTDFFKMDSGMKSRAKLLATYSEQELENLRKDADGISFGSPCLKLKEHWDFLSEKLNTSPEVLGLWLLKLSADRFLDTIEYKRVEESRVDKNFDGTEVVTNLSRFEKQSVNLGSNNLVTEIKSVTRELRIQVDNDATKDFINFMRFSWANNKASRLDMNDRSVKRHPPEKQEFMRLSQLNGKLSLYGLANTLSLIYKYALIIGKEPDLVMQLKRDYEENKYEECHPYKLFLNLNMDASLFSAASSKLKECASLGLSLPDCFEKTMHNLLSKEGFKLVGSYTQITTLWENSKQYDEKFVEIGDRLYVGEIVPKFLDELFGLEGFDPSKSVEL